MGWWHRKRCGASSLYSDIWGAIQWLTIRSKAIFYSSGIRCYISLFNCNLTNGTLYQNTKRRIPPQISTLFIMYNQKTQSNQTQLQVVFKTTKRDLNIYWWTNIRKFVVLRNSDIYKKKQSWNNFGETTKNTSQRKYTGGDFTNN